MNKLPQPPYNDDAALTQLSNNRKVGSYPHLQPSVPAIIEGYRRYREAHGNARLIENVVLANDVRTYLKGHYAKPPADLAYINAMRQDTEDRVCPMCGSMHRGTLDHLLPKEGFTAFSVFSLNLIPACKCNIKRGERTVGNPPGERILHPYFDECLDGRLISARFERLGRIPRVSIQILVSAEHPQYDAISFHVREIVLKTAVLKYLSTRWGHLCTKPKRVIRALEIIPMNEEHLSETLNDELELTDELHEGKNSWNSLFIRGLLDEDVTQWLFARLTDPNRPANGPLV